jgi:hypothetical protein
VKALRDFALVDSELIVESRDASITTKAIRLHRLVREVAAASLRVKRGANFGVRSWQPLQRSIRLMAGTTMRHGRAANSSCRISLRTAKRRWLIPLRT